MSLAQIGEFAFVLLSRASNMHLVEVILFIAMYRILMKFDTEEIKMQASCSIGN
jgi:predicted Kef-type K+ transport protein